MLVTATKEVIKLGKLRKRNSVWVSVIEND